MTPMIQTGPSSALSVKEVGPTHTPTLVFLHGGGGAGWMWQPQVEALCDDFHCLIPDLPAHGGSRNQPFTIEAAARSIAALIRERAHGGRAAVVGLSLGAQVLVQLLATDPQIVSRALISSALVRPLGADWLSSAALLRWTYRLSIAPFKSSAWYTRLNMRWAAGVPETYFAPFNADYQHMSAESFAQITQENMRFRLSEGLEQAKLPVLVVVGKREYPVMQQSARDLVAALPQAKGVIVDVGRSTAENHNWNLNAPALFTRMVRAWMTDEALPTELSAL